MKTVSPTCSPLPRGFHPYLAQWFRHHFAAFAEMMDRRRAVA